VKFVGDCVSEIAGPDHTPCVARAKEIDRWRDCQQSKRAGRNSGKQKGATMAIVNGRVSVACLTALVFSGCMGQPMPTAESITGPTVAAFSQLGAWRPWRSASEEALRSVPIPEAPAPVAEASPPAAPPERSRALEHKQASQFKPKRLPVVQIGSQILRVQPASVSESVLPAPLPTTVSCTTVAEPGKRVRMECNATE
jgi:cell division protein FtsN